jgi:hypothetical protein
MKPTKIWTVDTDSFNYSFTEWRVAAEVFLYFVDDFRSQKSPECVAAYVRIGDKELSGVMFDTIKDELSKTSNCGCYAETFRIPGEEPEWVRLQEGILDQITHCRIPLSGKD